MRSSPAVESYSRRVIIQGMLSSTANVSAALLVGVDPAQEHKVSQLNEAIIKGSPLSGHSDTEILIGYKMAKLLQAGPGDRLVMSAAQAHTGQLMQELFRVSGIFRFNVRQLDENLVFTNFARAQKMAGLNSSYHEIAIRFHELSQATDTTLPLWTKLKKLPDESLNWRELTPALSATIEMTHYTIAIIATILFAIRRCGTGN